MDFGEVLAKSWKIIWKHKVLWLFGILASCSGGQGGGGGNGGSSARNNNRDFGPNGNFEQYFNQFRTFIESVPIWVWVAIAAAIIFFVLLAVFLGTIGRIGLIRGTIRADEGAEHLGFGEIFRESLPFFWRIFLLDIILMILFLLILAVILVPGIAFGVLTNGMGLIAMLPLLCVVIICLGLFSWALRVVLEQAIVAIVAMDLGLLAGLERGWWVVRSNLGPIIIMALIVTFGGGIAGFLIGLPFILIAVPIIISAVSQSQAVMGTGLLVALVMFLVYLPIAIVLGGILKSYIGALWTLTFRRLTGTKPAAPASPELPGGAAAY